ncbi:hypothetical protein QFC19_001894 [Naganishia cerealis]|uniref:Uncharacterized protein n=1 Tax=Naganishia cerealis TaxID=610337 RepID=A0ACC2WDT4_9TREE|nr:hypothetical protein QFC19_001894 [Naganishia cerealis]
MTVHTGISHMVPIARPCQRCVKKGMGSECTEGLRKKAKYLMDDSEKSTLAGYSSNRRPVTIKRNSSGKTVTSSNSPRIGDISELPKPASHPLHSASRLSTDFGAAATYDAETSNGTKAQTLGAAGTDQPNAMQFYPTDVSADVGSGGPTQSLDRDLWQETDTMYDNLPFDPAYPFGSEAANLEYAMLSSMFADSGTVTTPTLHPSSTDPPLFTLDSNWPESTMMLPAGQISTGGAVNAAEQERMLTNPFGAQSTGTTPGSALRHGDSESLAGLSFTGSAGGAPVESPMTAMTPSDVYSLVVKPQ